MSVHSKLVQSAFIQRVDVLRGYFSFGRERERVAFACYAHERRGNADVHRAYRPLVILSYRRNGCRNGVAERVLVKKAFNRISLVRFRMACAENERAVYPFRAEKKRDFTRTNI